MENTKEKTTREILNDLDKQIKIEDEDSIKAYNKLLYLATNMADTLSQIDSKLYWFQHKTQQN